MATVENSAKSNAAQLFGAALKKIRKSKGLSQERFGAELGLHRTHVGFLEKGLRDPSFSTVYKIAKGLKMSLVELMSYVEEEEVKTSSQK